MKDLLPILMAMCGLLMLDCKRDLETRTYLIFITDSVNMLTLIKQPTYQEKLKVCVESRVILT